MKRSRYTSNSSINIIATLSNVATSWKEIAWNKRGVPIRQHVDMFDDVFHALQKRELTVEEAEYFIMAGARRVVAET